MLSQISGGRIACESSRTDTDDDDEEDDVMEVGCRCQVEPDLH